MAAYNPAMEIEFENQYNKTLEEFTSKKLLISIQSVIEFEQLDCESVTVIWFTDEALAEMHSDFLDDPEFTDIMTFDLGENSIEAELYVSVDRAISQSIEYGVSLENELCRLLIHGMLHLSGQDDHSAQDYKKMKELEEVHLKRVFI
jgi:probable rRNA maturation factor